MCGWTCRAFRARLAVVEPVIPGRNVGMRQGEQHEAEDPRNEGLQETSLWVDLDHQRVILAFCALGNIQAPVLVEIDERRLHATCGTHHVARCVFPLW